MSDLEKPTAPCGWYLVGKTFGDVCHWQRFPSRKAAMQTISRNHHIGVEPRLWDGEAWHPLTTEGKDNG